MMTISGSEGLDSVTALAAAGTAIPAKVMAENNEINFHVFFMEMKPITQVMFNSIVSHRSGNYHVLMIDFEGVWIVQQDETPDNTILGVFTSMEEASEYAESVSAGFPNGAIFSFFPMGYRRLSSVYIDALNADDSTNG